MGRCAAGAHLRAAGCRLGGGGAADRGGAGPLPGRALPARHGAATAPASSRRRLPPTGSVWPWTPTFPHARYHLGVALGDAEQYDEAVAWLQQVLAAEPEQAEAYNSLGYCYSRLGQPAQAVAAFEQAIALQPDDAQAHVNLGLTLLQLGDYPRGFAEYEWRWQTGQLPPFQCPHPQMGRPSDPRPDPAHPYRTRRRRCHPVRALPAAGGPALWDDSSWSARRT